MQRLAATLSWIGIPPAIAGRLDVPGYRPKHGGCGAVIRTRARRPRYRSPTEREATTTTICCLPPEGAPADAAAPIVAERLDLNAVKASKPLRERRYDIIERLPRCSWGVAYGFKSRQLQDAVSPPTRFLPITVIVLPQSERTGQAIEQPFGARVSTVRRPNFLPLD
jgi:hypothetical protein